MYRDRSELYRVEQGDELSADESCRFLAILCFHLRGADARRCRPGVLLEK